MPDRELRLGVAVLRDGHHLRRQVESRDPEAGLGSITELVVAGTANTMPEKTLQAFADHGEVQGDKVTGAGAEAQQIIDQLTAVGVDFDDVVAVLEREGLEKFDKSWTELVETVQTALQDGKKGKASPGNQSDQLPAARAP